MGRHRGWTVSAPGTATVTYPTRGQAESVASNVVGAKVSGSGCPLALLMLPLWPLLVAVHLIKTSAAAASRGTGGLRAAEHATGPGPGVAGRGRTEPVPPGRPPMLWAGPAHHDAGGAR